MLHKKWHYLALKLLVEIGIVHRQYNNILDRVGLWHVSNTAYHMFCVMENELCRNLTIEKAVLGQNQVTILVNELALNTEVLFHWNEIFEKHSQVPEEKAALLLRDIIIYNLLSLHVGSI